MSDLSVEENAKAIKAQRIVPNAIVLSNVIELSVSVIASMSGKEINEAVNRDGLSRAVLSNTVANLIKDELIR